jgi:diacylglycerol kinase (ATP)
LSPRERIRFLVNPAAARGRGRSRSVPLEAAARRLAAPLTVTTSAAHLRALARRAAEEGVERLVVAGGDGSLHHAIQELAGTECALAPVPTGRGNDLATCLELRGVPWPIDEWVAAAPTRRVDLGRAGDVRFGVHCGVGFDSEAARWANEQRLVGGVLSYPLAFVRTLARFEPPRLRVEYEGGRFDDEAMFVVCANCWRFGGGMKIAPGASIVDGRLDLVLVRSVSRPVAARLFSLVYSGRHVEHPAVTVARTRWARISLDRELEMYGDGEAMLRVGQEPLEVEALPGALNVVGAPGTGGRAPARRAPERGAVDGGGSGGAAEPR